MVSPRKSRRKSGCFSSTTHIDAGAREQEAEHHPGRPASGDRAARRDLGHSLDLYDGHLNLFNAQRPRFAPLLHAHSVVVMPATAGTQ